MKKTVIIIISALVLAAVAFVIITGFTVQTSAYIGEDYEVSQDGSEITFKVGIGSSMGFVRGYKDEVKDNAHYLKFYSAWGGFNSSLGAKNTYTLKLDPDDTEIYVYHGESGYALALQKDAAGRWQ